MIIFIYPIVSWLTSISLIHIGSILTSEVITFRTINIRWIAGDPVSTITSACSPIKLQTTHRQSFHNHGEGPYLGLMLVESA